VAAEEEAAVEGPLMTDEQVACLPLPELAFGNGISVMAKPAVPQISNTTEEPTESVVFASAQQEGDNVYRVGVFEDATTLNFWAANGPDNTVWNSYMLPERLTLYGLSDKRFDFIPNVALDLPAPLAEEGDYWVVEIPIRNDITWSDGEAFTAEDVAWTANTVLKFGLISGNWSQWYDANYLAMMEAVDEYTVKIYYHTKPGLARHEWGTLQAPILAEHYWAPFVDEAAAPIDALAEGASDDEVTEAQAAAHDNLFAVEPDGEPMAGAFTLAKYEPGAFIENPAYADYYQTGVTIIEYANGAYQEEPGFVLYGDATGDVDLEVAVGPFVEATIYSIYGSQDAALLALENGEIDAVLHPLGLQRGLQDRVEGSPDLEVLENGVNGFRYMAFNLRRRPMNDCSFRQAVAILIDKDFVTDRVLQGVAFSLYTFVPEANEAWFYDDVPKLGLYEDGTPMSREDRVNMAVAILEQAGYTWDGDMKPTWDADNETVTEAGTLIMPDGTPVPPLDLWAPSAGYDPLRATFATWIEKWLQEAGIPLTAHTAGFNALIPRIFTNHDFDMYELGWSLGLFPSYMRDFWHTEQAVPDGNNAAGYSNPEFDEASDKLLTCDSQEECKAISDSLQVMLSTEVPYVLLFDTGIMEPYRPAAVEFPYLEHLSGLQYAHQTGGPIQAEVNVK
jgi:ABC-type transport system substrate-binding protein